MSSVQEARIFAGAGMSDVAALALLDFNLVRGGVATGRVFSNCILCGDECFGDLSSTAYCSAGTRTLLYMVLAVSPG